MRPRTLNPAEQTTIKINPGPGNYEKIETITKVGKNFISKHRSSGCTTINPACSKRFNNKGYFFNLANKNPGPGLYEKCAVSMTKNGEYYVSKFHNSMCRSFCNQKRHGVMESVKE